MAVRTAIATISLSDIFHTYFYSLWWLIPGPVGLGAGNCRLKAVGLVLRLQGWLPYICASASPGYARAVPLHRMYGRTLVLRYYRAAIKALERKTGALEFKDSRWAMPAGSTC